VKRGQEESDLERIQDLFPNDCLRLYDKDVITMVSLFPNDCLRPHDQDVITMVYMSVPLPRTSLGPFQPFVQWISRIKETGA
jgi:hypothetical protein